MRVFLAAGLCCISVGILAAAKNEKSVPRPPVAPKAGIKIPGIQIPSESLKSEADLTVETPGLVMVGESIFAPSRSKDIVVRIDPKTNKPQDPITDLKQPCSGTVAAFASLWIPSCGAETLTRYDIKTRKVTATLASGAADVTIGIAATADSVWMITDSKTTLSRIDPIENKVVGELRLPAGCNSVAFGGMSVWVTCPSENRIVRVDPVTNLVAKRIELSAGPRAVAFGAGSVWVLCEKDGKVERIDPKTNKVIKTLELMVPNAGGNIAFGDGFVWVTQTGFPLTRIDPQADKERVVQQFWGDAGGLIATTSGAIWLSNVSKGTVSRLDPKRVIATLAE